MARYKPFKQLTDAEKIIRQAERQAKTAEAAERIQEAVQSMIDGDQFKAVLKVARTLHRYSIHNTLMIWSQRKDATQVAGFEQWKKLDRHVVKGAKSIKIWVPLKSRAKGADEVGVAEGAAAPAGGAGGDATDMRLTGKGGGTRFMLGSVFDIADTSGTPLPELPKMRFSDEDRPAYHEALRLLLDYAKAKLDCSVTVEVRATSARGSWSPAKRDLWVAADGPVLERLSVTCHEVVHGLAGHQAGRISKDEYALQEVVADGGAFLVMDAFGFDTTSAATPYLASYANSPAMLIKGLTEARALADAIIQDLEGLWLPLFPEVAAAREQAALLEGVLTADGASDAGDLVDGIAPLPQGSEAEAAVRTTGRVGPEAPSHAGIPDLPAVMENVGSSHAPMPAGVSA